MRLFREGKGNIAYTIVESDGHLPEDIRETALGGCATAPSVCSGCHGCG